MEHDYDSWRIVFDIHTNVLHSSSLYVLRAKRTNFTAVGATEILHLPILWEEIVGLTNLSYVASSAPTIHRRLQCDENGRQTTPLLPCLMLHLWRSNGPLRYPVHYAHEYQNRYKEEMKNVSTRTGVKVTI